MFMIDVECTNWNDNTKIFIVSINRKVLYVWVLFFGSTEEARKYSCRISIANQFGNEFNYSGPVHSLDPSEKAIINSGYLLLIGSNAAKTLVDKEKNWKIEVTISIGNEAISTELQDFYQSDSDSECVYSDPKSLDSDSSLDPEYKYSSLDSDSE